VATVELEIPSRSVYVGVVRLAVATLARESGLDEERVDDLRIAVSEACANALSPGEDAPPIQVTWTEEADYLAVEIQDDASNFYDPVNPAITGETADDRLSLSIELLKSLVDQCDIETSEGGRTRTRLVVQR
jgi:serine/threonine-protein kinase RsbW